MEDELREKILRTYRREIDKRIAFCTGLVFNMELLAEVIIETILKHYTLIEKSKYEYQD